MAPNEARKNNEGSDFVTGLATWAKREPFIRMFPIYRKHILLTLETAGVILPKSLRTSGTIQIHRKTILEWFRLRYQGPLSTQTGRSLPGPHGDDANVVHAGINPARCSRTAVARSAYP